ncbi:DEAD-box ATP-dependent RNA helicase 52B, variant 2, partial [Lathyrus oleraceus]
SLWHGLIQLLTNNLVPLNPSTFLNSVPMLLLPTTTEPIFLRPRIHHLSIAPLTDHVAEAVTVMVLHVISLDPNNNNRRGTSTTTTILLIGTIALRLSPALSQKTALFCFPIISGIMKDRLGSGLSAMPHGGGSDVAYPTALILSPTRELSCQIHAEANKFAYQTGVKIAVAYGGAPIGQQLRVLERGVDILVATPGRLVDMIERERVSLKKIKYLALDEADRMLDMGFEHQIRNIVQQMNMPAPGARQTLLFSATFPDNIQKLASDFLSNYVFLAVGRVGSSTELIVQKIESVQDMEKRNRLVDLLRRNVVNGKLALSLIFVETKKGADALESWLCRSGFPAIAIHGDKVQM